YFFFQAEDGIRDFHVTGVQTCALPILEEGQISLKDSVDTGNGTFRFYDRTMRDVRQGGYGMLTIRDAFEKSSNVGISKLVNEHRSEERRVGRECRSQRSCDK